MRHLLLLSLALAACGDSSNKTVDAAPADMAIDMAAAATCATYCATIATACTGANAQYGGNATQTPDMHCQATCMAFNTSQAMTGATLGCHAYHANNAAVSAANATIHCPHAGPAGDVLGMAGVCGDPCTNFCTIEIAACGLMGAAGNTTGQYTSMVDCTTKCAMFSTAVPYKIDATTIPTVNPSGDNLACRLYHATNAIITGQATVHCPHTAGPGVTNAACHI